jgi:phage terminase small subunit
MKLTKRHKDFCMDYLLTRNGTESYLKFYTDSKRKSANVAAHYLLKRPEIQEFISFLEADMEEKEKEVRERAIAELKKKIISMVELDVFHSQVVRCEVEVEDVLPVREYIPFDAKIPNSGRWLISFKRIKRLPNLRERQISAAELYRRQGAYAPTKTKFIEEGDGLLPANGNGNGNGSARFVILANGEKIPI